MPLPTTASNAIRGPICLLSLGINEQTFRFLDSFSLANHFGFNTLLYQRVIRFLLASALRRDEYVISYGNPKSASLMLIVVAHIFSSPFSSESDV
jgi:hypothetical protein